MARHRLLPIASVLSLAVLAAVAWPAWGGGDAQGFETTTGLAGWALLAVAAVLAVVRPAKAPSDAWAACAVLAAACLAASWLVQPVERDDDAGLNLAMVIALSATMVTLAASSRAPDGA